MSWDFEIDSDVLEEIKVPFLEDATGENAPNSRTTRSVTAAQSELSRWLGKHGGIVVGMIPVKFNNTIAGNDVIRYGFIVDFIFAGGARGRMHIAAIPMRKETIEKKNRVLAMALVNRAEFFKTAFATGIHDPYSNPLMQYLLVDENHTVAQMIVEKQKLTLLGSGVQSPNDES
jgi:hypothetical protein